MYQIVSIGGEVHLLEVAAPVVSPGGILIRTSHSLISSGTESVGLSSGGKGGGLILKAMQNPHLVRKVLNRVSGYGLRATANLVRLRLSSTMVLGYSCSGVVMETGEGVTQFRPGDRVACAGGGYANHASFNFVPKNLAARIPDPVSLEEAAFGTLGAVALQGVRRLEVTLGERIVIIGLGLLGLLAVQLLKAAGAVVIGLDIHSSRIKRGLDLGMDDGFTPHEREGIQGILERTDGVGADGILVCAASPDAALLNRAFDMCRRRGRVVLVGDVPIRIHRDKIYKKELDFRISCSYGPGRYDANYEEKGQDYPIGYVRWTEGRNLEEILRLMSMGQLKVKPLMDQIFPVDRAAEAYTALKSEPRPVGVLIDYQLPKAETPLPVRMVGTKRSVGARPSNQESFGVGFIGAGAYSTSVLLPLLKSHTGFRLVSVCSRTGLSVNSVMGQYRFLRGSTDYRNILEDPEVDVVFIATRHDLHYPLARAAVEAKKTVFVEKPMAMTIADAQSLVDLVGRTGSVFTVGFNRRFSPHAQLVKERLRHIAEPKMVTYRVNAGPLPSDHWLLDPKDGGGRILGEGVHFFDLVRFFLDKKLVDARGLFVKGSGVQSGQNASITLDFEDGSLATIVYTGQGHSDFGKERIEVFAGGSTFLIDDFKKTEYWERKRRQLKTKAVDKGQQNQLDDLYRVLKDGGTPGVTVEDGFWATYCAITAFQGKASPSIPFKEGEFRV